jgi:uncharacterized protein YndB with AHSA1/START domain
MTDMDDQITRTQREVGEVETPNGTGRVVRLQRTYDAPIDDVWSACTEAERLGRWFTPVTGDLHLGGKYQLEGNAGGEIVVCEPPRRLVVTWIYGDDHHPDDLSEVEVLLSPTDDGGTRFELEHRANVPDKFWSEFGPGAVGMGWDLSLLGLAGYVRGEVVEDKEGFVQTPEARDFMRRSAEGWRVAHQASGATPEEATSSSDNTLAAYAPEEPPAEADTDG